jgi:nitrite reductase (cytochrome c-552)
VTRPHKVVILSVVVVMIVLGAGIYFFSAHNQDLQEPPLGEIAAGEVDPAVWGKYYPRHYDSYQENFQDKEHPSHFETRPYMKTMYAGGGFGVEFNEPRWHVYTLEDIRNIDPARRKAGAACNTCKSPEIPALMDQYGDKYYQMTFEEINDKLEHPIACLDCHDPKTMDLKLTRKPLLEALQRQGQDTGKFTRQELRSLVCAQCHVNYYFEPGTKKIVFPWDQGLDAGQMLKYFDDLQFVEWNHPLAGTGLLKARHPDYEMFQGSTHQTAGLACADCHMPYTRVGNVKISSHRWTSPLNNIEQSCTVCHREGVDWLQERVQTIQSQTKQLEDLAGQAVVEAINELAAAQETPGVDEKLLQEAREMHRKGQWYLDYVLVNNGGGFHNPTASLNCLGQAIDYAHRSVELARASRNT